MCQNFKRMVVTIAAVLEKWLSSKLSSKVSCKYKRRWTGMNVHEIHIGQGINFCGNRNATVILYSQKKKIITVGNTILIFLLLLLLLLSPALQI